MIEKKMRERFYLDGFRASSSTVAVSLLCDATIPDAKSYCQQRAQDLIYGRPNEKGVPLAIDFQQGYIDGMLSALGH